MWNLKYYFKFGLLYFGLFALKKCTVTGIIHLCHDDVDLILHIPSIGSSSNKSICLSTTKDKSDLTVQLRHNTSVYYTSQDHVQFSFVSSSNYTVDFLFFTKINSSSDYGAWTVNINETSDIELTFTLLVVQKDSTNIQFVHEKKTKNNEEYAKLICKGTNYPKYMEITFVNGNLMKSGRHNPQNYQNSLVMEVDNGGNKCSLFGSYICTMTDFRNRNITSTLEVNDPTCDPKLCTARDLLKNTNENNKLKSSICVIHYYTKVNVTLYDMKTEAEINDTRWSYVYKPKTKLVGDVELTLQNVMESDFKTYKVVLNFTPEFNLTHFLNITLKDHPTLLINEIWMPKDLCNKNFPRSMFRKVRSGLQLSAEHVSNNDTRISIIHKYGSVDYYVKVVFNNCTQYVNKSHVVNIKAGSSVDIPMTFKLTEQPDNNISLCNYTMDGLEYFVQLGEMFEIQICVNSKQVITSSNIGINGAPATNLTSDKRYLINVERKAENQTIVYRINNISSEDVKMYVVKIKNNKNDDVDMAFLLRLIEGPPVFCNETSPKKTFDVTIGDTLNIQLCLQSYPELSSDVVINGVIYNFSSSSSQIAVKANFDDVLLQYYVEIAIINITEHNLRSYNVSFKNLKNQILENIFDLKLRRELTTQIPSTTFPCRVKCLVTNHYTVTITQGGYSQELTHGYCSHLDLNLICNGNEHSCPNETTTINCLVPFNNAGGIVSLSLLTNEIMNSSLHCNGREIDETNCSVCYTQHENHNSTMKLSFTNYTQDDIQICALKLWDQSNQVFELNITIHFKIKPPTSSAHTSPNLVVYICVIAVTVAFLTSISFVICFFYRSRSARKYKVVTDTQHYANIFDIAGENLTDTKLDSNGYSDALLLDKVTKSDLSLNKSSFKKKGSGHLKYVHFGSTSEGLETDQSTDVTSLHSTIIQCSETTSSLASCGLCKHASSEQCRCASVSSTSGRYVSEEGLIYLDLSHSDISSIKAKASFKKSQASNVNDKVVYAQLDFNLKKKRERKKSHSKKRKEDLS